MRVDGADVLEVYEAALAAIERAREGGGPTLIESVSLRWRGHAGHDPAKYVPPELLEHYMAEKDPVRNFEEWMLAEGVVTKEDIEAIAARVEREFEAGYDYALASPFPEPGDVTKGLWVEDGYWAAEAGRGGGTEAQLMATSRVEAGAAGHGAEPRGKRADDGQATYLIAIAEALWEEMERDDRVYHARRGHRRLRRRVQGHRGLHRALRPSARDGHADRGGDDRRDGGGVGDGGAAAGRRVPIRRLHVVGVRRDHDRAGALPLPHRRPAAGGAARAERRRRPRLQLPLHQPRAVVRLPAGAQGGVPGVPRGREGPAEVGDPRRQPRDLPRAQMALPPRSRSRCPTRSGLPGPAGLGRRQARGHRRRGRSRTARWCTRRWRPPRTWPAEGSWSRSSTCARSCRSTWTRCCAASRRRRARWWSTSPTASWASARRSRPTIAE